MIGERPEPIVDARDGLFGSDREVSEVSVLLTNEQAAELEAFAHQYGLTAGEALRRLIMSCLRPKETRQPREAG